MVRARLAGLATAVVVVIGVGLCGCRTSPVSGGPDTAFVSGSASADDGWTTPARPTSIAVPAGSPQAWSDGIPTRSVEPAFRAPPPPPAPGGAPMVVRTPPPPPVAAATTTAPCPPPAAPVAATPLQTRTYTGCGLPCSVGISQWHVRGVVGWAFWEGDDPADDCGYWGVDVGRTFCGCWGIDAFYRYNSGRFDRRNFQGGLDKDGGTFHHVGLKLTYELGLGSSRFYLWGGAGPEYYWSEDYITDDEGWGVFGELGVGYVLNQNLRIRAGINVHGMDTAVTRREPADDGKSRWLWILAPVVEVEFAF